MFLLFFGCESSAKKYDYSEITSSPKIKSALEKLENTKFQWALDAVLGENLTQKPVAIRFMKLSYISVDFRNSNAVAVFDNKGKMFILIDNKFKNALPEAIASLLCHEIIHQDNVSSIEEETRGWTNEARCWIEMTGQNPELANANTPLVNRLNTLAKMYKEADNTDYLIKQQVLANAGYVKLTLHSPGF